MPRSGAARTVIAEINPRMPRTGPESEVPVARFDHVVAVDDPIIEYLHEPLGRHAERIARYVARIIDDGATLQIGLGRVPNEMLRFLGNRRGPRHPLRRHHRASRRSRRRAAS